VREGAKDIVINAKSEASDIRQMANKARQKADVEAGTMTAKWHNEFRKAGKAPPLGEEPEEATQIRRDGEYKYEELRLKADEVTMNAISTPFQRFFDAVLTLLRRCFNVR